jgi:hypothetical protein
MGRWRLWLAAAACAIAIAGCTGTYGGFNKGFDRSLADAVKTDQVIRLRDLTDFDWTRVALFVDSWNAADVNSVVGSHVMDQGDSTDEGTLIWVFEDDGKVVRAFSTSYYAVLSDLPMQSTWDADVRIAPTPGRSGVSHLLEPDTSGAST